MMERGSWMRHNLWNGRYGFDRFSFFILALALLFLLTKTLWFIGILLIAYLLFRAFSKNTGGRQRELWAYTGLVMKIPAFFRKHFAFLGRFFKRIRRGWSTLRFQWQHRKEAVFPRCPKCRSILKLPRGKGKLLVTCPVCGHEFKTRT